MNIWKEDFDEKNQKAFDKVFEKRQKEVGNLIKMTKWFLALWVVCWLSIAVGLVYIGLHFLAKVW